MFNGMTIWNTCRDAGTARWQGGSKKIEGNGNV